MDLSRRDFLASSGLAAAGLTITTNTAHAGQRHEAKLTQGTNVSVAVSPDAKLLAIDLVTAIWVLNASGGVARRLTDDLQDATLPDFSPDGREIVFQSYRDANYHLYVISADGGEPRKLTDGKFDHREPVFSPDGTRIAFTSDRAGSYAVWVLDRKTGETKALTGVQDEAAGPQWSADGQRIIFTVNETAVDVITVATGERVRVVTAPPLGRIFGANFGPDGKPSYTLIRGPKADLMLGDQQLTNGEDVFGFAATWVGGKAFYTADGRIRTRDLTGKTQDIPFEATVPVDTTKFRQRARDLDSPVPRPVQGIASPVVSADQIAFRALNGIYLVDANGGRPRKLIADGFFNSDPDFSPDGKKIVYSSDRNGTATLRLRDLESNEDTELSPAPGAQLAPRFAPDGKRIAYTDQDGAVWILDVATKNRQQVTTPLFMPGRPTWSPDGTVIALAAVKPFTRRFREGTSQILTVDLVTSELRYTEPMPLRSIATRGDDGPVWSPDGKHMAFVVESTAWVVPVDAKGRFTGSPRQVTHEVTDSLAWQGSDQLVYLNNGRLRRVAIGGQPRTIRLNFNWRRPKHPDRMVIQAGAVWDGESNDLRRNVDIVVEGGRVKEIRPHRATTESVLDARNLVAMPGLIDAHNHWHLRGRQWGARQGRTWLAYGVTTTRSPGDPVYQMVETREALDAGTLVGPRFVATGEAIDGPRVYYNFMRPTLSKQQLDLELRRAAELGYDMIKTYVRLPVDLQRATVRAAHREGIPLSSHYLYPAANIGMDGMEHTGATNRLGYSHTVSRIGRAYQDVVELFVKSGMSVTPTLFHNRALYAQDKSLVTDERTRVLFPPFEHERYVLESNAAGTPGFPAYLESLASTVDLVLRVHRGGGLVICGTDAPLDWIATSLHQNLRAMVLYGFTPLEALITATRNPARWMGLEGEIGTLRAGAFADITMVEGNPLADIRAASNVRHVVVGGRVHSVESLLEPYRKPRPAGFREPLPALPSAAHNHDHWWHEPEWSNHVCCS